MYKKFIFILFVFILIFITVCNSSFADGGVLGLTWDIPESPDYPNHTYIFIYKYIPRFSEESYIRMIKYYMPITLEERSSKLRLTYANGLEYNYNFDTDTFEFLKISNNSWTFSYYDEEGNLVNWDDSSAHYGFFPLASNHNIYIDDDTLFFWTPQQSMNCPHLYRLPVTRLVVTLLTVGGRTLGIALAIFGILLGISSVKRLISWFLL